MHELGHNFDSGHTHDGGYSPRIDTCGCPYSNGHCTESCPSQLPLAKSATLMSYCHLCSGRYSNIDYTFGGKYRGYGPRGDINSYSNSSLAGSVSNNPRQVNVKMWDHVSSRGTCTEPYPIGVVSYFAPTPSYLFCSARMLESILSRDRCFPQRRPQTPTPTPKPTTPKPTTSKPTTSKPTPKPTSLTERPVSPTSPPSTTPTTVRPTTPEPTSLTGSPVSPTSAPTATPTTASPTDPEPPMMEVEIRVLTDRYPAETTWTLDNQCGEQTSVGAQTTPLRGGPYDSKLTWFSAKSRLPASSYEFNIVDTYGDGLCCDYGSGGYSILVDGVVIHTSNGKFARTETKSFGTCESPNVKGAIGPSGTSTSGSILPSTTTTTKTTAHLKTPKADKKDAHVQRKRVHE